jgi:ABC-type sugar transport system ATPase subunit
LEKVCKSFDSTPVLRDISLELAAGELLVLLGPSGCGKSTLLRLIAGLETLDSGRILMDGKELQDRPPRDRDVAMVFQNYSLYPHMSVAKNLAFPLKVAHASRADIERQVAETAEMLGLSDHLEKKPGQLSGGQRQRVALGRAIVRKPSLFLLDEPLSNLDAHLRERMRREIVRLQRRLGVTTVHVTHDQVEALTMADRVAILHEGKIAQIGPPEELYRNPANLFVAEFIGHPRINVIDLAVTSPLVEIVTAGANFSDDKRSSLLAAVRPEAISLTDDGPLRGVVSECEYVGEQWVVTVVVDGVSLVTSGATRSYETGENVSLAILPDAPLYFDRTHKCDSLLRIDSD